MHSTLTCLLLAAAGAAGLQLAAAPSSLHRPQLVRHGAPCMQESPEPPPSQQLSDETLRKAAETASEPSAAWPTPEVPTEGSRTGVADDRTTSRYVRHRGLEPQAALLLLLTRLSLAWHSPSVRPSTSPPRTLRAVASCPRRVTRSLSLALALALALTLTLTLTRW